LPAIRLACWLSSARAFDPAAQPEPLLLGWRLGARSGTGFEQRQRRERTLPGAGAARAPQFALSGVFRHFLPPFEDPLGEGQRGLAGLGEQGTEIQLRSVLREHRKRLSRRESRGTELEDRVRTAGMAQVVTREIAERRLDARAHSLFPLRAGSLGVQPHARGVRRLRLHHEQPEKLGQIVRLAQ
jgi:hypothetical protein